MFSPLLVLGMGSVGVSAWLRVAIGLGIDRANGGIGNGSDSAAMCPRYAYTHSLTEELSLLLVAPNTAFLSD